MTRRPVPTIPADLESRLLEAHFTGETPTPSKRLRACVLERVAQDVRNQEAIVTTRSHENWKPFAPGVEAKVLHDDGSVRTWLARLEAGARVPPHVHDGDEEILLLEGACIAGGVPMQQGDYQFSPSGSHHGEMTTASGCVLLLRSRSPALPA